MSHVHITLKVLGHAAVQNTVQIGWNETVELSMLDKYLPPIESRHRRVIERVSRLVPAMEFYMLEQGFCIKIEVNPQEYVEFCDPERKASENVFFRAMYNATQGKEK